VRLLILRDDLHHPLISGNKWRKLKGLLHSTDGIAKGIITYGGAFSNHIHATAAACKHYGITAVGIIRGEYDASNPTLIAAKDSGMTLHFVSRADYRLKADSPAVQDLISQYPDYTVVPEGGSGPFAMVGLAELGQEIAAIPDVDLITVSAGTGMTAAGIIKHQDRPVQVYSSLKDGYLRAEIGKLAEGRKFSFVSDYHFGGYGKVSNELVTFINSFLEQTGIPLDPIYNGKAIYGVLDQVSNGYFPKGTTILHIHTGGLQGINAYNYMAAKKGKTLLQSTDS